MANKEENEALGDVEIGKGESPATHQPAPPNVLEQARLGSLDLFRTELESGNHPLHFKAGRAVYFNRTPLHLAAMEGHGKIVEFILSRLEISREVVNAKDCFGYTPLHLAVRHSHKDVVRLLTTSSWVLPDRFLAATSEPDDLGEHYGGCTPLHLAAMGGHIDIAKLLFQQPCQMEFAYDPVNIFAMTWRNLTPMELARQNKFWELGDFLEASDLNCLQQERTRTATSANAVLVGAALVAAAAFSASLQPPGGIPNPDSEGQSFNWSANHRFYYGILFAFSFSVVSLGLGTLATFPKTDASLEVKMRWLQRALQIARMFLRLSLLSLIVGFSGACALVFDKVESRDKYIRGFMFLVPHISGLILIGCFWYWE